MLKSNGASWIWAQFVPLLLLFIRIDKPNNVRSLNVHIGRCVEPSYLDGSMGSISDILDAGYLI